MGKFAYLAVPYWKAGLQKKLFDRINQARTSGEDQGVITEIGETVDIEPATDKNIVNFTIQENER
jgi:hypothetical protein